jgi:ribosomal protein S17E
MITTEEADFDFSNLEAGQKGLIENLQTNSPKVSLEEMLLDIGTVLDCGTNQKTNNEKEAVTKTENHSENKKRKLDSVALESSNTKKKVRRNNDFSVLNDCYISWIESLSNGAKDPLAPSGCHVFKISTVSSDVNPEIYYFGICEPEQFSSLEKVKIEPIRKLNEKNYSLCKENHENEKKILNRCFCGLWGSQHKMKTHCCPFTFEYKTSLNDKFIMEIMIWKKKDEKNDSKGFQFKSGETKKPKDISIQQYQFFWGLTKKKERENLEFTKSGEFYKASVNLKKFPGNDEFYVSFKHSPTGGLEYPVIKTEVNIKSTKKSINTTPKSAKSQTLYLRLSEFSMTCSVTYMLILYCSIKKVPLEKMKNDYMISNDDLINQRDSDDLKKNIFDLDKNAILGKNGLFWLIFFNQDDSNLLEQLQHEFKEEFDHQMKFLEKYRNVDSEGQIVHIKKFLLDYRFGSNQSIHEYIDLLEELDDKESVEKSQTLYLRLSEFSKKCSVTYMLILYCSIKKVPLEKMKNDYMISNDDLINQRDSDDLKKNIFDLDENAILGKNGLFWLIFFNQDDSNLLEQLQHEFKEEFEHQMKFVEKYRKVYLKQIKRIVEDYRYGFNQNIQDYIDSLEESDEEEDDEISVEPTKIIESLPQSSLISKESSIDKTSSSIVKEEIPRKYTGNEFKSDRSIHEKEKIQKEEIFKNENDKRYTRGFLADSYKHQKTFFVQESNIGFFKKETNEMESIICNMKKLSIEEELSPTTVMLHKQDSSLLLLDNNRVFQFDIESTKIVGEWTSKESVPILSILPKSKFSQRTDENIFIGMNKKTIFGMDPRINKMDKSIGDIDK